HPHYRERLLAASTDDAVYLEDLFDIGWPNAPHRVLRNKVVVEWEAAGRPPSGERPGEGEVVVVSKTFGEVVRYRPFMALADVEGDVDALPLWAGQSVGLVRQIKPAAEIVHDINAEARCHSAPIVSYRNAVTITSMWFRS